MQCMLFTLVVYLMIHFEYDAGKFFFFWINVSVSCATMAYTGMVRLFIRLIVYHYLFFGSISPVASFCSGTAYSSNGLCGMCYLWGCLRVLCALRRPCWRGPTVLAYT